MWVSNSNLCIWIYTKEINLERIHFPLHTYHKTKRDLNDEHTSDKSLLSFTGQNPLKILLNPLKLASQIGVEPTTFRLGVDPIRWNQVQHSARKSLEIQGFSQFQILSGITLHKHFHRDFTPSNWLEISKAFDFRWTLQVQANSSM